MFMMYTLYLFTLYFVENLYFDTAATFVSNNKVPKHLYFELFKKYNKMTDNSR